MRRIVFKVVILLVLLLVSGCGSDSGVGGVERADSSDLGSSSSAPIEEEASTSAVSIPMVDVDDYQIIVVDQQVPGCSRALYLDPPSVDWTFEVGLEDLDSAPGIGTWKYSDGQVDVYRPGRVTGQLAGLEFSSLPVDGERVFFNYAAARADDGSLVLVEDIAIEDVQDLAEGPWCPVELRFRGLSPEEEELFLNGFIVAQDTDSSTILTLHTELQQEVESPESRLMVDVDDYQRVVVDHRVPGCYRILYLEPPSVDWTFEVGLEDLDSALGIGTWKYSDGQVEVYYPGRVTGQLAGLEFSSLPNNDERNFYNYATARADDGSLVLVKDVAIEDVRDPDEGQWCPLELRLRGLSPEEEELFLNGFIAGEDM